MKLSFETVRRLEDSGKYKMVESDGEAHLVYYPPSVEEASGENADIVRTMEIRLRKVEDGYEMSWNSGSNSLRDEHVHHGLREPKVWV